MKRFIHFILLLFICCGCTQESPVKQDEHITEYTIGILLKSMDSQHWMDIRAGIHDAARDYNVNIILLYPSDESAVEEQKHMFYDLVQAQPDALILAPCDSEHCTPLAVAAEQQGIPLLILDTPATDIVLPYVGADNERIGRMAATRLAVLANKTGTLAVITGVTGQSSHTERIQGFTLALQGYPAVQIVNIYHGDSSFRSGMQCMEQIMQEHPDIQGVFCTNAAMALGAIEQLEAGDYERMPYIVAVDTQDDALEALRTGALSGLVSQDGYEAGYRAVARAVKMLHNEDVQKPEYIDTSLLTQNTVEAYIEKRNARMEGKT